MTSDQQYETERRLRNRYAATTIAVVGDVHDLWDDNDRLALKHLGIDLVLLVGDFGNESVEVVRSIAAIDTPKAAVFGNHDAWYTATDWGRRKCPYDRQTEDWVQQQIDLLGTAHVGYSKLDFPELGLSVVGGRPFSWGGGSWKHEAFYQERYGVNSFAESTDRIVSAVESTAFDTVIFIGHCGPAGLGSLPEDPCGRDWKPLGGDFGDPDLAAAIEQARRLGKTVPLVAFGHMHHHLRHTRERLRRQIHIGDETLYLNAASVPRIIENQGERLRNFSLVTLVEGSVTEASLVWLDQSFAVRSQQVLYKSAQPVVQLAPS
jgi:uncharacterized protein (TIGR04168 family)